MGDEDWGRGLPGIYIETSSTSRLPKGPPGRAAEAKVVFTNIISTAS